MTTDLEAEALRADAGADADVEAAGAAAAAQCQMYCRCPDCTAYYRCPDPATIRLSYGCDCAAPGCASGVILLCADHSRRWADLGTAGHPVLGRRPL